MIAIIAPYPHALAPSQRFRFEQYVDIESSSVDFYPFWNPTEWPRIYKAIPIYLKVLFTIKAFTRRFISLFKMGKYDRIFIHREATPIGPPWFEWCLAKIYHNKIIYDFDDAIWLPNASATNQKLIGNLKTHNKVAKICSWAATVTVGNQFLADYASQFCRNVRIIPTTIDTEHLHNPAHYQTPSEHLPPLEGVFREERFGAGEASPFGEPVLSLTKEGQVEVIRDSVQKDTTPITIGWTGTHSTLKQLIPLFPLLEKLHAETPFNFLLIADKAPDTIRHFVEFLPWNKATEIQDLMRIDIGIMPLFNTDWERGKCGFKALQYMALGTPCVISDVGVNAEIVKDGQNGFLAESMPLTKDTKWFNSLKTLLLDPSLRKQMGAEGRQTIEDNYSVKRYTPEYSEILAIS